MSGFFDADALPALDALRRGWSTVREEYLALDVPITPIHRQQKTYAEVTAEMRAYLESGGTYGWMTGWGLETINEGWTQYGLITFGRVVPFVLETMPQAIALLEELPGVETAAVVKLAAGAAIGCHRHVDLQERGVLLVHLTIDAAPERNYAYLNVAGEFRQHRVGEILVFDGGLDHFAINESPVDRVVFYLEMNKEILLGGGRSRPKGEGRPESLR